MKKQVHFRIIVDFKFVDVFVYALQSKFSSKKET